MSIKLRFEKGSLSTQVMLKDEAMPELLKVISDYQSDESLPPTPAKIELGGDTVPDLNDPSKEGQRLAFAQSWLGQHSASEVLTQIGWQTFPERILLLGALHETTDGSTGWRNADIDAKFKAAREHTPGNFARDISNAIKAGIIATVTPRTYKVSKTGWLKIYDAIIKATISKSTSES
jgi:hypothetical protein